MVDFLKNQVITDKTIKLIKLNKYVFNVDPRLTKKEIVKLFTELFNVKVLSVNSLILSPKRRRLGRYKGVKNSYKRVFVSLRIKKSINFFS
uniref:Large ribosomal subunit protein uL23c n=1 Tax=Trachelomonas volvocina TaxID=103340 RepID=A0A0G3VPW3_9EUGL|nr:ribosomal protein L23 [Trachelomonas volvocina]AKL82438.1 ribosomal protein L23 [Trachelomonas volvocina]